MAHDESTRSYIFNIPFVTRNTSRTRYARLCSKDPKMKKISLTVYKIYRHSQDVKAVEDSTAKVDIKATVNIGAVKDIREWLICMIGRATY